MRVKASSIGTLAKSFLSRGPLLQVKETFRDSIYLGPDEMVIVTRRGAPSPISVTISQSDASIDWKVPLGERVDWSNGSIKVGDLSVDCRDASLYKRNDWASPSDQRMRIASSATGFLRSAFIMRMLYDAIESEVALPDLPLFANFTHGVLLPFAHHGASLPQEESGLFSLIGAGPGFTPAGDDFVTGFTLIHNALCTGLGLERIRMASTLLLQRTNWASAMFVRYAQRGLVDAGLSLLVDSIGLGDAEAVADSVLSLSSRGHTSGLDLCLGAILCSATLHDHGTHEHVLEKVLGLIE